MSDPIVSDPIVNAIVAVLESKKEWLGMGDRWEGWHELYDQDRIELATEIAAALSPVETVSD